MPLQQVLRPGDVTADWIAARGLGAHRLAMRAACDHTDRQMYFISM
jgi:hypothetical protein